MKFGSLGRVAVTHPYIHPKSGGSIWCLHGTGDTGSGMKTWLHKILDREFIFNNHKISYPTAPSHQYDLFGGRIACVWYNRLTLSPFPEDINSIQKTAISLGDLIKEDSHLNGIPMSRVIVGGFSLGGSMALHLAYRLFPQVAGCFVLSSFLPPESKVYDILTSMHSTKVMTMDSPTTQQGSNMTRNVIKSDSSPLYNEIPGTRGNSPASTLNADDDTMKKKMNQLKLPKLFMSCGTDDPLVRSSWAKSTFSKLRDHGIEGHFYTVPHLEHTIHPTQLHLLHNWIEWILADSSPNFDREHSIKLPQSKEK